MSELRLNAYRIMWLFVFFDLPTNTKAERRHAAQFRKALEKDGFTMMQYSVYVRHCASKENMAVHLNRVRKSMPPSGYTSILSVTDKQYGEIRNFWGHVEQKRAGMPQQLEFLRFPRRRITIADRDYRFRSELFLYSIRLRRIYSRRQNANKFAFALAY